MKKIQIYTMILSLILSIGGTPYLSADPQTSLSATLISEIITELNKEASPERDGDLTAKIQELIEAAKEEAIEEALAEFKRLEKEVALKDAPRLEMKKEQLDAVLKEWTEKKEVKKDSALDTLYAVIAALEAKDLELFKSVLTKDSVALLEKTLKEKSFEEFCKDSHPEAFVLDTFTEYKKGTTLVEFDFTHATIAPLVMIKVADEWLFDSTISD